MHWSVVICLSTPPKKKKEFLSFPCLIHRVLGEEGRSDKARPGQAVLSSNLLRQSNGLSTVNNSAPLASFSLSLSLGITLRRACESNSFFPLATYTTATPSCVYASMNEPIIIKEKKMAGMKRMFHNIRDGTNCLIGQFFFFNSLSRLLFPPRSGKEKLPHSTHVPDVPPVRCQNAN